MKSLLKFIIMLFVLLGVFFSNLLTQNEPAEKIYQTYILDSIERRLIPHELCKK